MTVSSLGNSRAHIASAGGRREENKGPAASFRLLRRHSSGRTRPSARKFSCPSTVSPPPPPPTQRPVARPLKRSPAVPRPAMAISFIRAAAASSSRAAAHVGRRSLCRSSLLSSPTTSSSSGVRRQNVGQLTIQTLAQVQVRPSQQRAGPACLSLGARLTASDPALAAAHGFNVFPASSHAAAHGLRTLGEAARCCPAREADVADGCGACSSHRRPCQGLVSAVLGPSLPGPGPAGRGRARLPRRPGPSPGPTPQARAQRFCRKSGV